VTYVDAAAFRTALEHRLHNKSRQTSISIDRLRRRVVFERVLARLHTAEPGVWVLKGGMALEVRLRDNARLTKDLDLGMRGDISEPAAFHDRLIESLATLETTDFFQFRRVEANLAGRAFGTLSLDVSPRAHELTATEHLTLPNSLDFAGIPECSVEVVDVHRHAAEKLHAISRQYGDRENSRVRDLVDLVLLVEHDLLDRDRLALQAGHVWAERDRTEPPDEPPALPFDWAPRYADLAALHGLPTDITEATDVLNTVWPRGDR
jgi:predicted nucleotidyltransferase component of viral defense system